MRDDLLEAVACIDWAVAQLPLLEVKISDWREKAYTVRVEADPQKGKNAYFIVPNPIPALIIVEVGTILHIIRSSLDVLANVLAIRNGHGNSKDTYFPICRDLAAFLDTNPGGGKKKIKRLSAADQAVIEGLKPYKGGNDILFSLHELDNARKHRRLLKVATFPRGIGIYPKDGSGLNVADLPEFNRGWKGLDDKAIPVIWLPSTVPDCNVDIPVYIAFGEGDAVKGQIVTNALSKFACLANSIIKLFDRS